MSNNQHNTSFNGKIIIIGMGSIAQGLLPLLFRHIDLDRTKIICIAADDYGKEIASSYNIEFMLHRLTPDNYYEVLSTLLTNNDFLVNLSVDVASSALIKLCQERNALYIDTCFEPWEGGYTNANLSLSERSNFALRYEALRNRNQNTKGPTAVLAHGANPGIVSHLVKEAMLTLGRDILGKKNQPKNREEWATLAMDLNIKAIQIAERDTQIAAKRKTNSEFVNTWSVDGFISEGLQPAELGWGTHEQHWPDDAEVHSFGNNSSIYLKRPGASIRVKSWTPQAGPFMGYLITHNEAISIAEYFTVMENDKVRYRPTVYYAYHPCDDAVLSLHELAGRDWEKQHNQRLLRDEIDSGIDELGVLLLGHARGAYWYGSQLSIEKARSMAPHNNATSLQVAAGVLAGMIWAMENPQRGPVEAEEMDHARVMEIARPYWEPMVGKYSDWKPLPSQKLGFVEDCDRTDPWQFLNFRQS